MTFRTLQFFPPSRRIPFLATFIFFVALQWVPMLRDLNVEFAAVTTLWILALGALLLTIDRHPPLMAYALSALLPLLLALCLAPFRTTCNLSEGILFYLLIPFASALLTTSLLAFVSTLTANRGFRLLLYLATILGSLLLEVAWTLSGPGLFLMEPFFGYLPGPIYDEYVPLTPQLLLFRCETFAMMGIFMAATFTLKNGLLQKGPAILLVILALLFPLGFRTAFPGLGLAASRKIIEAALSHKVTHPHFDLYLHPSETLNKRRLQLFLDEIDYQITEITQALRLPPDNKRLTLFVYRSGDLKKRLIGARNVSIGNFLRKEVHLNTADPFSATLKHELTHVLSGPIGIPLLRGHYLPAVFEGLAVAVTWDAGEEGQLSPHVSSRILLEMGHLPDMERLFSPTHFWQESMPKAYTAAGSFTRYLLDTYPIAHYHCLYGGHSFQRCYATSIRAIEKKWHDFLKTIPLPKEALDRGRDRFSAKSVFHKQCPHESARLAYLGHRFAENGQQKAALESFSRAYQKSGCSPEYLNQIYAFKLSTRDFSDLPSPPCAAPRDTPPYLHATELFFKAMASVSEKRDHDALAFFKEAGKHPWYRFSAEAWLYLLQHGFITDKTRQMPLSKIISTLPPATAQSMPLLLYLASLDIASVVPSKTLESFIKTQVKVNDPEIADLQIQAAFIVKDYRTAAQLAKTYNKTDWLKKAEWFLSRSFQ